MKKSFKIALAQINPIVGDLEGNGEKILDFYRQAAARFNPDLIVFPECAMVGYPPEDLLHSESFVAANMKRIREIASSMQEVPAVIGFVNAIRGELFNAAAVVKNGKVSQIVSKQALPNYGVFDEKRYFVPGKQNGIVSVKGTKIGLSICEDIWDDSVLFCRKQAALGAEVLINISASPYHAGKFGDRLKLLRKIVRRTKMPIVYVNMVGGQDELVFDGRSVAVDRSGKAAVLAKSFEEDLKCVHFERGFSAVSDRSLEDLPDGTEEVYKALVLGTRDYVQKNRFEKVVIGLSGGIDSSLVAAIAVEALGRERVLGVTMPSRFTSHETRTDAEILASNLMIPIQTVPIEDIFAAFLRTLEPLFKGTPAGLSEENLQSRIRGMILMAISNRFGHLVLTTGNKSEVSVGYSTLYGDTAGGFAIIKDVPKTLVYPLSRFVNENAGREVIPESVFTRPPTAELRPNQTDQDTLPPYDLLDRMIRLYVEEDRGFSELLREGFDPAVLRKVIRMIDLSEYKRRQSPPGVKITPKSFGKDRRMPITNRYFRT